MQVENVNFLQQATFNCTFGRLPHIKYFMQHFKMPGMQLPTVRQATPFKNIPRAGDHMTFENLSIEFKVDEDLRNYFEVACWLHQLGFPRNYAQYRKLDNEQVDKSKYGECTVTTFTNSRNANLDITFSGLVPTSLSGFNFETTTSNVNYVSAVVTFEFENMAVLRRDNTGTSDQIML